MSRGPAVSALVKEMGPVPRVPQSWQRVICFSRGYYSRPQDDPAARAVELNNEEASIVWGGVSTTVCSMGNSASFPRPHPDGETIRLCDVILRARVEIYGKYKVYEMKVDFGGGDYSRPYAAGGEVL